MGVPGKEQYEARLKRVESAVRLEVPDRVPVACCQMGYYMTRMAGLSNAEAMVDHQKRLAVWKEMTQQLRLDLAPHPIVVPPAQPFSILGVKQFQWPGGDLADDAPFQYIEDEYMKADEYDAFLADPGDFTVRRIWPRLASALKPLSDLRPLHWYSNSRSMANMLGTVLGTGPFVELLQKALEMGRASLDFMMKLFAYTEEMRQLGFPTVYGSAADAPFDYLADQLRGTRGSMLDMYRRPDKILAVVEIFTTMAIEGAKDLAGQSKNPRVFMPLHRGAAGFMSDDQFRKFYWPSLKKVLEALVEAGLTPAPFFEGDYTPRLEYLAELPPGRIAAHFDRVDRRKAKKIIGDTLCFWGNVPAGLLITGTPEQVRDDVKELIDTFAGNGGLIVDGSMGIPDEARPENVEAMIETVFEYGVNR